MSAPRFVSREVLSAAKMNLLADAIDAAVFDVRNYGATGNGTTDDTAAFQAAAAAAWSVSATPGFRGSEVYIPPGEYRLSQGLTITRPVNFRGAGENQTRTFCDASCANPVWKFEIATDTGDYLNNWGAALVHLSHMAITGDKSGPTTQHAMYRGRAGANPIYYGLKLSHIRVSNMGGSGLAGAAGSAFGFTSASNLYIFQCDEYGLDLTGMWDGRFFNCEIGVCRNGYRISNSGGTEFYGVNTYACSEWGAVLFASAGSGDLAFTSYGGAVDSCALGNVSFDSRVTDQWAKFIGTKFGNAGAAAPNTKSDIVVASGALGVLDLVSPGFRKTFAQDATEPSQYNINFAGGSAGRVSVIGDTGWSDPDAASFTNEALQVDKVATGRATRLRGTLKASQGAQYTGISLAALDDTAVASLVGYGTAAGKGGALSLSSTAGVGTTLLGDFGTLSQDAWLGNSLCLGTALSLATPVARNLYASDGTGTNIAGSELRVRGGRGTGTGIGGPLRLQYTPVGGSGSAANSAVDALVIDTGTAITFKPLASVTPVNNGDVVMQFTSNTSLTFKLRGSDGTVRSGSITLS